MPNRLAQSASPYLLQHAHNPVDWYPWGPEAIERARREDLPIFLSIGYAACHWCHVMERESFEDPEIAAVMNRDFVCVKVDREERPDLDQIYMNAVQLMTGHGGWPMSMFLTPDLEPFFGGTYWPPHRAHGRPGFADVLQGVAQAWRLRRPQALEQAAELTRHLRAVGAVEGDAELDGDLERLALARLERTFDDVHGGFGGQPKFPHPMDLQLLLRHGVRERHSRWLEMAALTLDRMAGGGIYDHLGGGFSRYSVDERWLVPHFEKMLYDNGQLAGVYLDGWLALRDVTPDRAAQYAVVVRETLDYLLRDMADSAGGLHSSEDADSEGVEGKFYVWSTDELRQALGADAAARFATVYGVTERGNFEGHNILNLPRPLDGCAQQLGVEPESLREELARSRATLLEIRSRRVRPGKDDKVLVSWNALAIDSLARAGAGLDEPRYVAAAVGAAEFIRREMRRDDGRLIHSWRQGRAGAPGFLDDHAYLAHALVSLYEATWHEPWIDWAAELVEVMREHFQDRDLGGFFFTADDHESLIARNQDLYDASVPSASGMAASALIRLGRLCGRRDWLDDAERTLRRAAATMRRSPMTGQLLLALDALRAPGPELVILGRPDCEATRRLVATLRARYLPNAIVAARLDDAAPRSRLLDSAFAGKTGGVESPTLFVCRDFACQAPVSGERAIEALRGL